MDYSMQGSKDSFSPQAHNLYPHVQQPPQVYPPPPPNPQGQGYQQQYQSYLGEENHPSSYSHSHYGWSEHPPQYSQQQGPFQHGYQEDPDCITFLRGCFAGLCCCCLLEQCCL